MNEFPKRIGILSAIILVSISLSSAFTIDIGSNERIGNYLVNEKGMTLYYFDNDRPASSTCYESCAAVWPPFYAEWIDIPEKMSYEDFGEIGRVDGIYQTTYKNRPLYLYSGDQNPGDINGEGMKGAWFAMRI
jgi:predicted lipoprotein with Yx(FWY)xxD motif